MRTSSTLQNLAIVAMAIVIVGVASWAAISSITAANAPSGLTATAGDTQVTLTWNPQDSTITGYRVLWMEPTDKLDDPSKENNPQVSIEAGDMFGQSVGIDGDRAVVGAPFQKSRTNANVDVEDGGWPHAYSRSSGEWSYDEFLAVSNPQEDGRLGNAVAMAGRTAVAGAPSYYQDPNADPGRVTIAVWDSLSESWASKFSATGVAGNDFFGTSVAIDGGTAVVGAPGVAVGSDTYVGKAYVFTRDSSNQDTGSWSQETVLDAGSNAGQGTVFGTSVAVDGNTIVVGANGEDTYTGAAYVFTKSNNVWSRVVRLTAPNSQYGDGFGGSVAIDGDTIVVGAQGWDGGAQGSPRYGAAFVFTKNNNVWTRVARLTASDYADTSDVAEQDQFGFAVAVEGDTIVVGNHLDDDDGDDSGSVYLFTKPSGGWTTANETVQLTASGAAADDEFGFSVAARGGRFIVGAPGVANEKGAAYVYSIPEWTDIPVPGSNSGTMSHTVTGLTNAVAYTFWVVPVVGSNLGPASDSVTATPTAAKAATPANLKAQGIDREVTLSWDDPNDSSIIRYRYQQKVGDGAFGSWNDIELTDIDSSETGKLKYTVSNLTNGTTYTFQIFAKDNHDDSETSAASATPAPPPPLPLVPVFLSNFGQVTDTSVGVDADLSSDQAQQFSTGADEAGYVLGSIDVYFQRGTDSEDLTVTVWNSNNNNTNPGSTVHTLTYPGTIEPGLVRFTAPENAQLVANTYYFVHVASSGSGTPPRLRTTASTNVDAGAAANWSMITYRHQADSSSPTGWSNQANLLKISINQVLDLPAAPANFEATGGDGQVVLSWDDPQDNYITSYDISADGGTNYTSVPINSSDLAYDSVEGTITYVTGLPNGATYNLAVRAVNSTGNGTASTQSVVMMPADTTRLTVGALDAKVQLSWVDPGNDTIATYQIWRHAQSAKLTAADADEIDALGNSVAVVGDTAVVGAPGDADSSGDFGAVLVFTRDSTGDWSQTANLKASDAAEDDGFGSSVAFDGDTIVVGAPFDDDNGDGSGSAYVFIKSNGDWGNAPPSGDHRVETAKLTAPDGAAEHYFGTSVVVYDGDGASAIVVGAYGHANTKGAAYVFAEPTAGWGAWDGLPQTGTNDEEEDKDGLTAKLTASDGAQNDKFGTSVAIDVDTIVVGADWDDSDTGSAYLFVKPETGWATGTETAKLTASDGADDDKFGFSVAVDDDTVVVGAYGDDSEMGSAYVFVKPGAVWAPGTETAKLTASDGAADDYFGYSVAVDDDTVVVGAYGDNGIEIGADSGLAYVFVKPGNDDGWAATNYNRNEAAQLIASNGAQNDRFGTSVAIDGGAVVVGASANAAYAFDALGTTIDSDSMDLVYDDAEDTIGYTVTSLTNYLTYTFKVWAVNPSGVGGAATATATPRPAPPAPQNLRATPGDRQVALSWDDPNDSGITGYDISTDGGESFTDIPGSNAATTSYTVTGLAHSTTYTLSLRAVNPSGDGDASTVTALTLPAKPTGLTGIEYNSQVELGWDGSDDSTITKYQLLQIAPSKLTAGDAGTDDDFFGMAVAVDGDTALVGALRAYDADFYRTGAAYIFTKNSESGEWTQATLTALDGNDGDEFGRSVSLDGDTAVVGAPGADNGVAGEGQVTGTGAAYVFIRDSAGSWTQAGKLTADDAAEDDQFAYSVAVYDDTVVIGAHRDDDNGAESGSAYVFTKPANGDWTSTNTAVKLTAPDAAAGGYYGNSVAIDGNTIVVGAHKADSAYAITKPSSDANDDDSIDWQDWDALDADGKAALTATLTAGNAAAGDEFGISVAIGGNTIVVGAHEADSAYAITKPSSDANNDGSIDWEDWDSLDADRKATLTATLTAFDATPGDEFGISVAVSGDTIVVGAHKDEDKGDEFGSAYVFTKPAAGWDTTTETAKIIDQDRAEDDQFGSSLAVDGSTVLIGARGDESNKGAAHIMGIPSWTDISDSAAGGANATSYTVTGLTNDVMYTFQLRAVAADSHSPASDRFNVTPKAVPHAPANLLATPGNAHVALSWDDPDDTTITGYQYQQAEGEGEFGDWADISGSMATTTSHTVTGLTNGTSYTFAVRAVNDSLGNGAASTVTAVMVPTAPTGLSAAPGDAEVALSWHDPGNDTIDEYELSQSDPPQWSRVTGSNATTTTHTVTGLTNYTGYSFQIRAVNETGAGPASNVASSTPRAPKPAKPTGLTAEVGDKSVMLNWDDPNNETLTEYEISEVILEDFLTATGGATGDHFGISVAIDGDTAVVGADRANNRKGSVYIFTRDSNGNWTQAVKLDGENEGDQFGWSVAVDGNTVVVGAHAYDGKNDGDETLEKSGAVYVITKPGEDANSDGSADWGDWDDLDADDKDGLTVKLTLMTPEADSFFGGSVDLDGDTLVIGARLADLEGFLSAGAAYVFTKDSVTGVWSQQAKLTASDGSSLSYLGYSVAVDGDTVLAGAFGSNTAFGRAGYGSAYVFDKPLGGWTDGNETAKLTASDRQPSDYFGFSVALDGDTAVIGASQHSDPITGAGSGAAYVFTRQTGVWGEKAKLTASDAAARDNFGVAVAMEGDTVVVGSWQDDDNGRNSGSAYVFTKPDLGWASTFETLKLTAPDGAVNDRFGWSVAVDEYAEGGGLALVGAYSDDHDAGINAGSAHVLGIPNWVDIDDSDDATTSHTVAKELDDPDTDLSNGDEYTFQVRALNRSGAGPASDGASATPMGVPAAPSGLSAAAGDSQVALKWDKPADDDAIATITGYKFSKDNGANFVDLSLSDIYDIDENGVITNAYIVTRLTNDTTYTFAVRAVNVIGEGSVSTVGAKPGSATPLAPANLQAAPGDTQVRLTWDDPRDSSIDKYILSTDDTNYVDIDLQEIYYGIDGKFRYTVTGLTNGTDYTFYLRAVDNAEQSDPATITAAPRGVELDAANNPVPIVPNSPTELKATGGHEEVGLTWDDPDDASIDKYQYQQLQANAQGNFDNWGVDWDNIALGDIENIDENTIGYTVSNLTNGEKYKFRIRAVDLVGEGTADDEFSGESDEVEAIPLPDRPRAPTNLNVTERNQEVTLTWRAPPGSVVDKYEVLHLQASELAAPNVAKDDKFGYSVAVDGDIAVVGAYRDDDNGADSGAAYVFTRSGSVVWDEGVKLTASDGNSFDNFGISVAVDGETIVIGAPGDDREDDDTTINVVETAVNSGSAYVFTKVEGEWRQAAKLTANDGESLDYFGHSVAVSGNTVLVGAYQDDREETDTETELEDSGSVYVFTKPTGGWGAWDDLPQTGASDPEEDKDGLTAKLNAPNAADDDRFGTSVALDDDTAVIGAPGDDAKGIDSGSVYVFVKPSGGPWVTTSTQTATLVAGDGEPGDSFGISVTVDGDTAVVGAYQHDSIAPDSDPNAPSYLLDAGAAYVFTRDLGGTWDTGEKLTAEDGETGDYFGYSVAVDVDTVVVGAYQDDDNGTDSGSAYIFTRDSETNRRSQNNKLTHENGEAGDWFGYSVAVDTEAHTALIGAGSAHVMDIHDWHDVAASGPVITHTIANLTNNRQYDFEVRAVNLAGVGDLAEREATPHSPVPPSPTNRRPSFTEGSRTTRTVAEDVALGTEVGEPLIATDRDRDRLQYSLSGDGRGSFDVDASTGQLITTVLLDHETQSEYSVRVRVGDGYSGRDVINVTIAVSDVDEPPSQPGAPEVRSAGPTGLTVSWTAPDNQGPGITDYDVQYREAGGEFQDAGYDGIGTSMTLDDLKPSTSYEVQVRAINDEGASPWSESGIGETEEAPTPTPEPTPTPTPEPTPTPTPTPTPEPTPTPTPEPTPTPTPEPTPTPTPEPTPTPTPEPMPTPTPEPTPTPTPEPTPTPTPEPTPTPTPEPTPTPTPEPTPTPTLEPTVTPTPEPTATPTPEPTATPTPEPTPTPTPEPTPTPTLEPTPTPTLEPTPTPTLEPTPTPILTAPTPTADDGDEGFPWWANTVILIGIVAGVVLIVVVRRRRRQRS